MELRVFGLYQLGTLCNGPASAAACEREGARSHLRYCHSCPPASRSWSISCLPEAEP